MSSANNNEPSGSATSNPNLGFITGENIKSCLNTLKQLQVLEDSLPKLLKLSEFWELDNKYIYELCQPYKNSKDMEDAFLEWILLDVTKRRQFFQKLRDFQQLQEIQKDQTIISQKLQIDELEGQLREKNELEGQLREKNELLESQISEKTSTIVRLTQELVKTKTELENVRLELEKVTKESQEFGCTTKLGKSNEKILKFGETYQAKLEQQEQKIRDLKKQLIEAQGKSPVEPAAAKRSNPNVEKAGAADTKILSKKAKTTSASSQDQNSRHSLAGTSNSKKQLPSGIRISHPINSNWNWIDSLDANGKIDGRITDKNWKQHASSSRYLEISNFELGLNIYEVYSALSPHITTLKLLSLQQNWVFDPTFGAKLCQFVEQFTNLQDLELGCSIPNHRRRVGLETFLSSFLVKIPTVNVLLKVDLYTGPSDRIEGLDNILDPLIRFGEKFHNLKLKFSSIYTLQQLQAVSSNCGPSSKSIYTLEVSGYKGWHIFKCQELETLSSISLQYPDLGIFLILHVDYFKSTQQETIKNYLAKLSSIITKLRIQNTKKDVMNVTNLDCNWPKLRELEVNEYNHQLEILKRCPKLEVLVLENVNLDKCVFHDSKKSVKASVTDYFSNLPSLKSLKCRRIETKSSSWKEFQTILKSILSPTVKIW